MKPFALLALFVAGVAANGYGPSLVRIAPIPYSGAIRTDNYGSSSSYGGSSARFVPITRFTHEIRGSQSDNVAFETGNGISVSDNTQVVGGRGDAYDDGYGNMIQSDSVVRKQGSYSYIAPDGQRISTTWVADENGFRAEGAHLPRPVEMPAEHAEAHRLALSRTSSYGSYGAPAPSFIRSSGY